MLVSQHFFDKDENVHRYPSDLISVSEDRAKEISKAGFGDMVDGPAEPAKEKKETKPAGQGKDMLTTGKEKKEIEKP